VKGNREKVMQMKNKIIKIISIILAVVFVISLICANQLSPKSSTDGSIVMQINKVLYHNEVMVSLTKLQENLNRTMAIEIKALKDQKKPSLLFLLMAVSFIYGIFHAMGPGHGKSIISSWIISQQRRLADVLFISVSAAAFHALSAALVVGGTYVILNKFAALSTQKLNLYLEIAAAILVISIGLSMIIRLIYGKCTKTRSTQEQTTTTKLWRKPLVVALSIGIVPCPVTSVILIFCLTLGLIWQGILLVISFAIGMGMSLVAISLLVWSLKEKLTSKKLSVFKYAVTNVFPVIGGVFLVFLGSTILSSLL
jgi:ABC-type nickel/cobalt efflux system permease component RcnA